MFDYDEYEKEVESIREENLKLLEEFQTWLEAKGLTEKTIYRHISNVDFYINNFLLYEEIIKPAEGACDIGMFLGYWFIKKALWSSVNSIKENIASLKKFYTFMLEKSYISDYDLERLKEIIKEEKDEWFEKMRRYDDPSITTMDEVWGYDFDEDVDFD
jgi:hypothetical protein